MKNYIFKFALIYLFICLAFLGSRARASEPQAVVMRYPDEKEFAQIIDYGLAFKHAEALELAQEYVSKHPNHPCGYFALGLVHEWIIEPKDPEPPLTPAIAAYERAGALHNSERADVEKGDETYDATAGICRGAALMHVTRIYYKYDKMLIGIRRAIAASHELEEVSQRAPQAYDAYTFLGPYHYFTDRTPAAARFVMRLFGLKGDREKGLRELEVAWEKAPLFKATAGQTLYVIRSQYEGDFKSEEKILRNLLERYPNNLIFQRLFENAKGQLASSAMSSLK